MTIKKYQEKEKYISKAREAEKKYGLPTNLLVGLLAQESGHFNSKVISGERKSYSGAVGIGQFMPKTAKEYNINPLNIDQAIDASAKYLSKSYKNLGNWDDAILSYNAGEGRVREYRAGKPIKLKEHQEYVERVKNQIQTYSGVKSAPSKDVVPYMNQIKTTTPVTNFDISIDSSSFASVPETQQKEEVILKKEEEQNSEALNKLKEQAFVKEYKSYFPEQKLVQQEQVTQQPLKTTDVQGIYSQVSNFVDQDLAQQGGEKNSLWKNIRANRGSGKEPTKEMLEQEAKIKRNNQQGGIPISSQGVYKHPMQNVLVPTKDGRISMKNVAYPILGTDEYGNSKLMQPGGEYQFQGKIIYEEPKLTEKEKAFLKNK